MRRHLWIILSLVVPASVLLVRAGSASPTSEGAVTADPAEGAAQEEVASPPIAPVPADVINVRILVTKAQANGLCPGAASSYVPISWLGETGNHICAADVHGPKTCSGVKYVVITADNRHGRWQSDKDLGCDDPVPRPWPWGYEYDRPDTLDGEFMHGDTWVVCCH
jgi:hypothetical protein